MQAWSFKQLQDAPDEREAWEKKTIYATDADKCLCGVYHQLKGAKPDAPIPANNLRRMAVGEIIEANQVKLLKRAGLFLDAQSRIFDEEYNVSGRHDGLIISPVNCTDEAKKIIEEKKNIYSEIEAQEKLWWKALNEYKLGTLKKPDYLAQNASITERKTILYDNDKVLSLELLEPNKDNQLMLLEFKSIVLSGFAWRKREGVPMDAHTHQIMFYIWKLRNTIPNLLSRMVYVDTSYQNILEFDVQYDENIINQLKQKWSIINTAVKNNKAPAAAPNIVRNPKGKWQVNWQADWCQYHSKCTGNPNWKQEAIDEVKKLNEK